jgi:hypothetical protein
VPTTINFTPSGDGSIVVSEPADVVARAFGTTRPGPAQLTRSDDGVPIYVNPAAVAYWFDGVRPERADSGIAASMSPL